ncbi:hypothetical protein ABPG72_001152 [Tetrahymena utriculariae]
MSNVILATASYDRTIKFWSYSDQKIIHQFEYCSQKQTSFVNKIEVSHDKQYLATAGSATINLYDLRDKYKLKHIYDGYKSNVTSVGFKQNNGWIYASSEDGSIKVHDLVMQGVQKTFNSKEPVNQVVLHPNEVELISADQAGIVKTWDLRKEQTYVKKIVKLDIQQYQLQLKFDRLYHQKQESDLFQFVQMPNFTLLQTQLDSYLFKNYQRQMIHRAYKKLRKPMMITYQNVRYLHQPRVQLLVVLIRQLKFGEQIHLLKNSNQSKHYMATQSGYGTSLMVVMESFYFLVQVISLQNFGNQMMKHNKYLVQILNMMEQQTVQLLMILIFEGNKRIKQFKEVIQNVSLNNLKQNRQYLKRQYLFSFFKQIQSIQLRVDFIIV